MSLEKPHDPHSARRYVRVRRVDECSTFDEIFTHCLPAFGGAYLRRVYQILDRAIGMGCPITLAISGPVTVSGQHQTWLLPLLETGWVAYLSTTDAVCYHDGHRSLDAYRSGPIYEVPIFGDDAALRDEGTIRVTDMAFDEGVLLDQDRFLTAVLARPEFQRKMTGTELRYLLGEYYAAQEAQNGVQTGLLSTCYAPRDSGLRRRARRWQRVSQFDEAVGHAPGRPDSRICLRSRSARGSFRSLRLSPLGIVREAVQALATLILGGGVPKNYNLQPEPALGQVLGLPNVRGYHFDVQIVTAPVTDGSLSSCPPAEAVTWGKVDKDTYLQTTESMQSDYSIVMPFLIKALLENRERYAAMVEERGEEEVFAEEPRARGYLRPTEGYRLYDQRGELRERLTANMRNNREWLMESLTYPLAAVR